MGRWSDRLVRIAGLENRSVQKTANCSRFERFTNPRGTSPTEVKAAPWRGDMSDRRSTVWVSALAIVIGSAVSCTGAIDDSGTSGGMSGGGNNPGGGGTGNNPGGGGNMSGPREPGRVTLRRLNQAEYDNTVRDLLGTASHPSATFLSDSVANGFDNNGDLLTLSPVRLGQYQQAAETLATEALTGTLRTRNLASDPPTGGASVRTVVRP